MFDHSSSNSIILGLTKSEHTHSRRADIPPQYLTELYRFEVKNIEIIKHHTKTSIICTPLSLQGHIGSYSSPFILKDQKKG